MKRRRLSSLNGNAGVIRPRVRIAKALAVYKMAGRTGARNKRYLWRCRACGEQYTVRTGAIYEDSKLPLRHWAYGFWRVCASKKGVSAREIERNCQKIGRASCRERVENEVD